MTSYITPPYPFPHLYKQVDEKQQKYGKFWNVSNNAISSTMLNPFNDNPETEATIVNEENVDNEEHVEWELNPAWTEHFDRAIKKYEEKIKNRNNNKHKHKKRKR